MRLIDANAMYERACSLEAQALDYVGKLIERDGDNVSVEWKIWSAILAERTAFKHDVFDAPTIEHKMGRWIYGEDEYGIDGYHCDKCGFFVPWDYTHKFINYIEDYNFCPSCGADMRGEENG